MKQLKIFLSMSIVALVAHYYYAEADLESNQIHETSIRPHSRQVDSTNQSLTSNDDFMDSQNQAFKSITRQSLDRDYTSEVDDLKIKSNSNTAAALASPKLNLSMEDQVVSQLLGGTATAVKNYDWNDPINMFKTARLNYKEDIADLKNQGKPVMWQDQALLGLKHYGKAYFKVSFGLGSEIVKVAGPKIAMLLITAAIAA